MGPHKAGPLYEVVSSVINSIPAINAFIVLCDSFQAIQHSLMWADTLYSLLKNTL